MPEIQMPKLSDTMTEGTLVSWKKKKGDQVSAGEVLAEIETDKATMEWEATDDGILKEIYVPEGGKVNVGERIAFIGEEREAAPNDDKSGEEKPAPAKEKEPATVPPQQKAPNRKAAAADVEAGVSPAEEQQPERRERPTRPTPQREGRVKASP